MANNLMQRRKYVDPKVLKAQTKTLVDEATGYLKNPKTYQQALSVYDKVRPELIN
ncbi:unnamed protein product [Trichogramma brassicae]|uniref:Uncharacterized protein n=1 Tax=Trichogramma brassicae TaxID=86971 RepID=A0A6H5IML5_9HYME|nr:unnamed protein product [Trichogramma brassicae]